MRMRKSGADDVPALKTLWKQAFGDTDAEIDGFFETVWPEAAGFCAEEGGAVIAMLFALPVEIVHGERTQKAAYLYAVATAEAFRGRGVCRALMEFAEKTLRKRYIECLLLVPADERLAAYYETMGYVRQDGCTERPPLADTPKGTAVPVTVQEYAGLRETLLFDVPHARYSRAELEYAAEELAGEKRVLYRLECGYACGCAAVHTAGASGGVVRVEELLPDAGMLPALAAALGPGTYPVRMPGRGAARCMAKWLDGAEHAPVWFAFALD